MKKTKTKQNKVNKTKQKTNKQANKQTNKPTNKQNDSGKGLSLATALIALKRN